MQTAAVLNILVKANTAQGVTGLRKTNNELQKVERQSKRSEGRITAIGRTGRRSFGLLATGAKAGGLALGVGVAVGAKKAATAAVDLGEQINKTKVVFRGSEKEILRWSKTTATSLGISRREALTAAGTFGNMLVPMGLSRRAAADMSRQFVELSADMASFNNASPKETLDALRSGLAGESEPLRKFGVDIRDTALKQFALKKGLDSNTQAMSSQQKALLISKKIFHDTKDAQGDFARTSGSLANLTRVLKAQLDNLAGGIGQLLLPALTTGAKALSGFIAQMQSGKGAGGGFAAAITTGFNAARTAVAAAISTIGAFLRRNRADIQQTGQAFRNIGVAIAAVFNSVVLPVVRRVFPGIRQIVQGQLRIIGGVVKVFSSLLTGDFRGAWEGVKRIFSGALKTIGGYLRAFSAPLREAAARAFGAVRDVVTSVFRRVRGAVGDAIAFILRRISDLLGGFSSMLSAAGKIPGIGGAFRKAARGIDDARRSLDATANAIDGVRKRDKTTVRVLLDMAVAPGSKKKLMRLGDLPTGGGAGRNIGPTLRKGIQTTAQDFANRPDVSRGIFAKIKEGLGAAGMLGAPGTARGALGKYERLGHQMGLSTTSAFRPGDPGWHGQNRARDLSDGVNTPGMMRYARYMFRKFGKNLLELIYTPMGVGIKNGKPVNIRSFFGSKVASEHYNHVHVAAQKGAMVPGSGSGDKVRALLEPGEGIINKKAVRAMGGHAAITAINKAIPRFQSGGVVNSVISAARAGGFKGGLLRVMSAIALGESGGNPRARGDGGNSHGLWQIYRPAHPWARRLNLFNPAVNAKAAMRVYRSQGLGAWTIYNKGIYRRHLPAVDRALKRGGGKSPAKDRARRKAQLDKALNLTGRGGGQTQAERLGIVKGGLPPSMLGKQKGLPFTPGRHARPYEGAGGGEAGEDPAAAAAQALVDAINGQREEQRALRAELAKANAFSASVTAINAREAIRFMGDVLSGQMGGLAAQRRQTAGDGHTIARW